jgi:hypothetical protein
VTVNVYVAVGDVVFVVVVFAVFVGFVVFVVVVVVVFVGGVVLQLWLQGVGGQEWTEYWMRERARAAKASKQAVTLTQSRSHSITLLSSDLWLRSAAEPRWRLFREGKGVMITVTAETETEK